MMRKFIAWLILMCTAAAVLAAGRPQSAATAPAAEAGHAGKQTQAPPAEDDKRVMTLETREQGTITGAAVTRGGSTYYLRFNSPAGNMLPGDMQDSPTRAAQWRVLQFDWPRRPDNDPGGVPRPGAIAPD